MWGTDMTTTALATGKRSRRLRGQKTIARRLAWVCTPPSEARASKRCNRSAKGCAERFGAIGEGTATGLTIRHDNGSQYISHAFLR